MEKIESRALMYDPMLHDEHTGFHPYEQAEIKKESRKFKEILKDDTRTDKT